MDNVYLAISMLMVAATLAGAGVLLYVLWKEPARWTQKQAQDPTAEREYRQDGTQG